MNAVLSNRKWPIYAIAGLVSILLSCWISARELVINPDGICYLMSAEALQTLSLSQVMHLCAQAGWPFYSWLIHSIMVVTGFSSLVSANIIDGFFSLMTVLTFMALIEVLGGNKRVLMLAAFVILFAHEFNSARQYIVRDHGYWAFYLLSLLFFIRCLQQPTWGRMLAWCLSLAMATLFRIEGAVFFILLPFSALFLPQASSRFSLFIKLMLPCLLGVSAVLIVSVLHPSDLTQTGRIHELGQYLLFSGSQLMAQFNASKTALILHVLPLEAARDAGLVWFLTLVLLYVVNVLQNVSFIATLLVIYAWISRAAAWLLAHRSAVVAYVMVNFIITLAFFAQHLFLSKRYLIALSLTLILWVPFALNKLYELSYQKRQRLAYVFALILIVLSSLGVIINRGPSKAYVREAGDWLAVNVPKQSSLFINDVQLMYYAKHDGLDLFKKIRVMNDPNVLSDGTWRHYDYIALRVRGDDVRWSTAAIAMNQEPVRTYSGPHGDSILIYKIGS